MDRNQLERQLVEWAEKYNSPEWFKEDPIIFPRTVLERGGSLADIEIAGIFSAHLAWGRRSSIVNDCRKLFDRMRWQPLDYVMSGEWRDDETSVHRTVKWSDTAAICSRLKAFYTTRSSLECLSVQDIRTQIYGQKEDPLAANKKINLMRRWFVRRDGKVDLGIWTGTSADSLTIPLDVHVYGQAVQLGLTRRKSKDIRTAEEITDAFRKIFPGDPAKGDFALFGYGVTHGGKEDA